MREPMRAQMQMQMQTRKLFNLQPCSIAAARAA
jgi:hypothetical protein